MPQGDAGSAAQIVFTFSKVEFGMSTFLCGDQIGVLQAAASDIVDMEETGDQLWDFDILLFSFIPGGVIFQ